MRTVLVALLLVSAWPPATAEEDVFLTKVRKAFEQAAQEDRPLMIVFRTSWCESCHLMERTTWRDQSVLDALRGFVPVSVDGEKNAILALRYGVEVYPTILFANSEGQPILVVRGFRRANGMADHILAVRNDYERLAGLAAASARRRADPEAAVALAEFAIGQEAWDHAEPLLRRALRNKKRLPEELLVRAKLSLGEVLTATDRCGEASRVLRGVPATLPEAVVAQHGTVATILGSCGG